MVAILHRVRTARGNLGIAHNFLNLSFLFFMSLVEACWFVLGVSCSARDVQDQCNPCFPETVIRCSVCALLRCSGHDLLLYL